MELLQHPSSLLDPPSQDLPTMVVEVEGPDPLNPDLPNPDLPNPDLPTMHQEVEVVENSTLDCHPSLNLILADCLEN